jgi:hypothetical protein
MNCLYCNKPIEGKRNTKKYCGNTCKQYAYLNRNFAMPMPSNLNALSLKNDAENKTALSEKENYSSNNQLSNNPPQITNTTNIKPIINHEYKNQIIQQEYKYIRPDILERIQDEHISLTITRSYFTTNTNRGGRMVPQNFAAFTYFVPRIRCIIENLFQLTYKTKIYYRTAITICKAIEEMLASEYIKQLPGDFPFISDLINLHEQFYPMAKYLEDEKEGTKFKLSRTAIVRYIMILDLIRDCSKKQPFNKLFPELCKPVTHTKPNTSKV